MHVLTASRRLFSSTLILGLILGVLIVSAAPALAASDGFEDVTPPALPAGWSTETLVDCDGSDPWASVNGTVAGLTPPTGSQALYVNSPTCFYSEEHLQTPDFHITAANNTLTFKHAFDIAVIGDNGGRLLVKIPSLGGWFLNIQDVGGSFQQGGYNSPYGWAGNSGGTMTTTVTLPAEANGQDVAFRFNRHVDGGTSAGWMIDDVQVGPPSHLLTVTKDGAGTGNVASDPGAIDCGLVCTQKYDEGTAVTLTPNPDGNSEFAGWMGPCENENANGTCQVTMGQATSVTATFTLKRYTLDVSKDGNGSGTVTGTGIDCGTDCDENFDHGTAVTLTPNPDASSEFAGWIGPCENENANGTCQMTMGQATSVTATFTLKKYELDVSKDGNGSGTVTGTGIDCGTDCDENFDHGTAVTLTPNPDAGSEFAGWMGPCENENANGTCQMTMGQATSVTATFTLKRYPLTVSVDGPGGVVGPGIDCAPDCDAMFDHGTQVRLRLETVPGAHTITWGGACEGSQGSCTVTMTEARNVTATFTPIEEEPEPTVLRFRMLLTLDLDGDQLAGTIGTDGLTEPTLAEADACTAGRWVKLMKETPGFDRTVAGKWTADDGSYSFDATDRAGRFYTKVKRKVIEVGNTTIICRAGRSNVERVL